MIRSGKGRNGNKRKKAPFCRKYNPKKQKKKKVARGGGKGFLSPAPTEGGEKKTWTNHGIFQVCQKRGPGREGCFGGSVGPQGKKKIIFNVSAVGNGTVKQKEGGKGFRHGKTSVETQGKKKKEREPASKTKCSTTILGENDVAWPLQRKEERANPRNLAKKKKKKRKKPILYSIQGGEGPQTEKSLPLGEATLKFAARYCTESAGTVPKGRPRSRREEEEKGNRFDNQERASKSQKKKM